MVKRHCLDVCVGVQVYIFMQGVWGSGFDPSCLVRHPMLCSLTPPARIISISLRHGRHDDTRGFTLSQPALSAFLRLLLSPSLCSFTLSIYAQIWCPFTPPPLQLTSLFHSIIWPQRPVAVATPPSGDGYLPCCRSNRFPVGFQMSHLSPALSFIF